MKTSSTGRCGPEHRGGRVAARHSRRRTAFVAAALAVAGGLTVGWHAGAADLVAHGLAGWIVDGTGGVGDAAQGPGLPPVWTAADGVIRCSGRGFGFLRHETQADDFRLELEYRFPKNGNSGIGIRTPPFTGDVATRPSQAAYEVQLLSDAGKAPDRGSCCAVYGHEPPRENRSRPVGEWNAVAVECRGPRILVWHNGGQVIDFDQSSRPDTAGKPLRGHVCLQNHGSAVEFRGIRLTELAAER